MRCLGLTNSSLLSTNQNAADSQSVSPNAKDSSPPLSPTLQPNTSLNGSSNVENHSNQSGFILMHPAFQHSQKMFNANFDGTKDKNDTLKSQFNCNEFASRALQMKSDILSHSDNKRISDSVMTDVENSSSSEEIDLTSNVCVDFSNNNNKNKYK